MGAHVMATLDDFEFFDIHQEFQISYGNLPHWHQAGATYFVTFRTEDSVPQELARLWHRERESWLREHGIDQAAPDWKARVRASADLEREYHARFTRGFMEYLDRGLGECVLGDQRLAKIVADCLTHFDRERYHLGDFVVMPNHVHLLVCLLGTTDIERLSKSWKRFAAREINRVRGGSGRFWHEESFDHLVRGPEQFCRFQRYIADNPRNAGLTEGTFLLRSLGAGREAH
jgi:REP element-mobilizing transposase RayT